MRPLSDEELLRLWEAGRNRHPLDRALLALQSSMPQTSFDRLADWPLGRRNRALLQLRCDWFGPEVQGWLTCARCGERLEFALDGRTLTGAAPWSDTADAADAGATIVVHRQVFRLPTSRDLALAVADRDPRHAAIRIAERCRITSPLDAAADALALDADVASSSWSDAELDEIGDLMESADPLAEVRLTLHCPTCDAEWDETLDIASFFWADVEARVNRLLLDVHTLASAYGWTEAEILALGAQRRARYVEMVQS